MAKIHASRSETSRQIKRRMDNNPFSRVRHHVFRENAPGIQQRGTSVDGTGNRAKLRERRDGRIHGDSQQDRVETVEGFPNRRRVSTRRRRDFGGEGSTEGTRDTEMAEQ